MSDIMLHAPPVQIIQNELKQCCQFIEKLAKTCCMKERSTTMNGLIITLDQLQGQIIKTNDHSVLDIQLEQVTDMGRDIGGLHVSCCIKSRETLYQELLKSLNQVFMQLLAMKGINH